MRPIMSSLIRRTFRLSRISPFAPKQQRQQTFLYSSLVSSSSSHPSSPLFKLSQTPSIPTFFHPLRFSSTSIACTPKIVGADEKLSKAIEDEIECAEETENRDQEGIVPEGFPFQIIDNPGEQTIILNRELAGESIQVEVHMPEICGEDEQDEDDEDDDDKDKPGEISIPLDVTVVKGAERLEFHCIAAADEISIESMVMKGAEDSSSENAYEGPQFTDLDEELQKSFHTYLEARGIKSSLTNFLQEYMMTKDNKEYLGWLKNMKDFVEK